MRGIVISISVIIMSLPIACSSRAKNDDQVPLVRYSANDTIYSTIEYDIAISTVTDFDYQNGNVYILDAPSALITVINMENRTRGCFGSRGEGPDQLGYPVSCCVLPNGTLAVSDNSKKAVYLYDVEGDSCYSIFEFQGDPPLDLDCINDSLFASISIKFESIESDGIHISTSLAVNSTGEGDCIHLNSHGFIADPEDPSDLFDNTIFLYHFAFGEDRYFLFDRESAEYLILCNDLAGESLYTIEREQETVEKTPDELAREAQFVVDYLNGIGGSDVVRHEYQPRSWREPVAGLFLTEDEEQLWVWRGDSGTCRFDVYNAYSGDLLFHAELPESFNDAYLVRFLVCSDSLILAAVESESCDQRIVSLVPVDDDGAPGATGAFDDP